MRKRTFAISDENAEILKRIKEEYSLNSEQQAFDYALKKCDPQKNCVLSDKDLEIIFAKFEKRSFATQVRLNSRMSCVLIQEIEEILNSLLFSDFQKCDFVSYNDLPNPILTNAKIHIKEKIKKSKQKKDFSKNHKNKTRIDF